MVGPEERGNFYKKVYLKGSFSILAKSQKGVLEVRQLENVILGFCVRLSGAEKVNQASDRRSKI